jgi:hypothetical protein
MIPALVSALPPNPPIPSAVDPSQALGASLRGAGINIDYPDAVMAKVEAWQRAPDIDDSSLDDRIDALFAGDLAQPTVTRPAHHGTLMGMRRGRVYVRLDDPPLEVKVAKRPNKNICQVRSRRYARSPRTAKREQPAVADAIPLA